MNTRMPHNRKTHTPPDRQTDRHRQTRTLTHMSVFRVVLVLHGGESGAIERGVREGERGKREIETEREWKRKYLSTSPFVSDDWILFTSS